MDLLMQVKAIMIEVDSTIQGTINSKNLTENSALCYCYYYCSLEVDQVIIMKSAWFLYEGWSACLVSDSIGVAKATMEHQDNQK